MSFIPTRTAEFPYMGQELVQDRIQTLHREAEAQRLATRVRQVRRARRQAERASLRLRQALARMA
ncbi:hypothetical protein Sru01_59070 [Sphaerisporangium rufum]|uniref:Uncharacterized protein n=1 Tax=Sphaerisporangium rufum TaxID=1381558 RepID=A0A919V813_9ACTN|nr:hypothetical protein [Sphaerisporangium rufum]GII80925.1 hypothetical protein Sru01_59070 [Sphaerisporangium rufum]